MTAMDGGGRLDGDPAGPDTVIDRRSAGATARALEEIFPLRGNADRGRELQETWRVFVVDMANAVRSALASARSPPQIACTIGEIVHNFFRTRGLTLTSYELRRLVADLLAGQASGHRQAAGVPLVRFASDPAGRHTSWTGAEPATPPRGGGDGVIPAFPSGNAAVMPPEVDSDLAVLVTNKARAALAGDPHDLPRNVVVDAIAGAVDRTPELQPRQRRQLARLVLSELLGLGPIDRLWADRSVRAVLVNGPDAVQIERDGLLERSPERFRDGAHLEEIVRRLAGKVTSPAVTVHLRDGSEAVVLFPPAAPQGPVLALRRGEPGEATLDRLVCGGRLSRPMADLLRIAVRSRLNVRLVGPERSGKTALLAAIARDADDVRSVTLARHRSFRWTSASKVELVVAPGAPFAALLTAAVHLRPDLLVVDTVLPADAAALADLLAGGAHGMVAAGEPQTMAVVPRANVDLSVSVDRHDGSFVVVSMEDAAGAVLFDWQREHGFRGHSPAPAFAGTVRRAGYGAALASVLR